MKHALRLAAVLASLSLLTTASLSAAAPETPAQDPSDETTTTVIEGTVVDADGNGVPGAGVQAYQYSNSLSRNALVAETTSGPGGTFAVTVDLGLSNWIELVARKEGLSYGWFDWSTDRKDPVAVKITKPARLAGIVVDENKKPVPGAVIRLDIMRRGTQGYNIGEVSDPPIFNWLHMVTDSDGKFAFTELPDDIFAMLRFAAPGYAHIMTYDANAPQPQWPVAVPREDLEIVLPPEARVSGTVVERDTGRPVAGAKFEIRPKDAFRGYYVEVTSGPDGAFRAGGLLGGECGIEMAYEQDPGWVAEPITVSAPAGGETPGVRFEVFRGAVLEVYVKSGMTGAPLSDATVVMGLEETRAFRGWRTDGDGVCRVRLRPGNYVIDSIQKMPEYYTRVQGRVELADGDTQRLEYEAWKAGVGRTQTVSGIVRDETGAPLEGVAFLVWPEGMSSDKPVVSDANGRFELTYSTESSFSAPGGASMDRYLVARHPERNLGAFAALEIGGARMDLKLLRGAILSGVVTTRDGAPIAQADISISAEYQTGGRGYMNAFMGAAAVSGADGRYEIPALPQIFTDTYIVFVRRDGYASKRIFQEVPDPLPEKIAMEPVVLRPADKSISGTVVDLAGNSVPGAWISAGFTSTEVPGTRREHEWQPSNAETTSGPDGRFVLSGVTEGPLSLSARTENRNPGLYGGVEAAAGDADAVIVLLSAREREEARQAQTLGGYASLAGKKLPALYYFDVTPAPGDLAGKRILVCFWESDTRPSRRLLRELASRSEKLAAYKVAVICVFAGDGDPAVAFAQAAECGAKFPMGRVAAPRAAMLMSWGARGLPWMVLTDAESLVTNENLALEELDALLK